MGIIELPYNQAILNKINLQGDWSFQISVLSTPSTTSHVSLTLDLDHFTVSGDKILIAVKTNGYVIDD